MPTFAVVDSQNRMLSEHKTRKEAEAAAQGQKVVEYPKGGMWWCDYCRKLGSPVCEDCMKHIKSKDEWVGPMGREYQGPIKGHWVAKHSEKRPGIVRPRI